MAGHPRDALAVFVTLIHNVDTVLSSKDNPLWALGKHQLSRVTNPLIPFQVGASPLNEEVLEVLESWKQ